MTGTETDLLTEDERAAVAEQPASRRWLTGELHRLQAFAGDDAPTDAERRLLVELARRADGRGIATATRRELAAVVGIPERQIGHGIAWAEWRGSFHARRVSPSGQPQADRYRLNRWPRP
ncbi:hypothetical protein IF188_08045 [Microbacterium sp. NEAU-LLC]|uniref:Helix-turn-helix domain-containing protein n=1 Tax=Microbacterium helvum TaxID=2773713 RepID=A0ABR8NLU4_9MICO|nr:hypothetical protein [Microbacterium helvum]MBD3941644.1 hypothetical protein [Microbacterium helvum]